MLSYTNVKVIERLLILTKQLVTLTSVHVILTELIWVVILFRLSANSSAEVVKSTFVLLHVHVASTAVVESLGHS